MESFEKHNYNLITATSCLNPDIRPKIRPERYDIGYQIGNKNCTASGIMLNLEDKEAKGNSSHLVRFELSMEKNATTLEGIGKGEIHIKYMIDDIDQCPDDVSKQYPINKLKLSKE